MDKSNKPTLAERQDELKARMTSGKYKALVSKPPTPLEPPAPSERSSMTVRELIQQLSGMDPECVLRVDMYDREYLLTRGTASYLEVGGAEPILRAIKGTGEKDDWEILDELRQANPWRGEPTGCCRLVGRKNKAEPCGRPAVVVHENSPFCWRHYPPHLEVRDREKSEFDEYRERCLEEQERKEAEMAAKPGAMEFLPESDSPFSIKPIANTWHYLPEVTHVSWVDHSQSWFVTAITELREGQTWKTEWDFELRLQRDGPKILIRASRQYSRKSNRGPWKLSSDSLFDADRESKDMLRVAVQHVLNRLTTIEYAKHEEQTNSEALKAKMSVLQADKPN